MLYKLNEDGPADGRASSGPESAIVQIQCDKIF